MNRRHFMESSAILSTSALIGQSSCKKEENLRYKMGYQLFSVNEDMNQDPIETLKALQKMGYEDFEIYGFDPEKVTYYTLPALEFKSRLDEMQLTTTSGHYGFTDYLMKEKDELRHFTDQCIKGAKALNTPYITWPWLAPEYRNMDTYKLMALRLNEIGEQVHAAGLKFAYHNHGFEFMDHDGDTGYDVIMRDTDASLVKLQLDMYWLMHSSTMTPKEMINKAPGRFVMWHIKDMDKVTRDYTELGNGSIDYVSLLPDPVKSGLEYYYLEQGGNFAHNAMQSAADSAIYFKDKLQQFL